jgi:hypothetical protein
MQKKLATLSALTTRFYWIHEKKKKQAIENVTQNFKKTKQVRQSYDFSLLNIVPQYKGLRTFLS